MNLGTFGGQVVVSGGLRGSRVTIDQLDLETGEVRIHLGEAVTDAAGRFSIETGTENGIIRVIARGGAYEDLATGATIYLDDTDEIRSLTRREILDVQDSALVSPIGNLIEARTMARLAVQGTMLAAFDETTAIFDRHFGEVSWGAVRLFPLHLPAVSPIEQVRAAFVHAALSVLVHDIAADAGAGPQDVTVYRLMQRWTEDIRAGTFDGNDGNDRTPGSGLQLGYCPPVDPACVVPDTGCTAGHCRRLCDLYAGTPRALLAGAMVKVIRDRGPGGLNGTGLDLPDTLTIVQELAGNADPALFDSACVEQLDRTPPLVHFEPPTPGGAGYVRGAFQVKAVAVDDVDPRPRVSLAGLVDLDGDPGNAAALATIDTAALADGPLTVVARATDLAGNTASIERALTIDNSAPAVTLDPGGFFIDGTTWWTPSATPLLTGTVADAAPVAIKAVLPGGIEVGGAVVGASWMISLPLGALDEGGTPVQIVAVDAAGNESSVTRRLRPDPEPPVLRFDPSTVNDEADEPVTFTVDHRPRHLHAGAPIDLAAAPGCPVVTKFSYLLGAVSPEYATESPGRNPIRYQLVTADPGVGIAAGSTQYRIGRRAGPGTTWIVDWTPAGGGTPIGGGSTRFPIDILSEAVSGLATTEGIYDVEFRAADRLERPTAAVRCFDLRLRAPPLELEPPPVLPTKDHAYSLDSLSLTPGAMYDQLAARLLNADATGASLIDQDVFNGTAEPVYLTVEVGKPGSITVVRSFVIGNATTDVVPSTCDGCFDPPLGVPPYSPPPVMTVETALDFPVKVFELVAGVPAAEIPCLSPCPPSGSTFRFAIPPRASGGQPARALRVMTMIGQIPSLWPADGMQPAAPPFVDDVITWTDPIANPNSSTTTHLTGLVDRTIVPERTGCVKHSSAPGHPCTHKGTIVPYRALRSASLSFSPSISSSYATSATATSTRASVVPDRVRNSASPVDWSADEGPLP